MTNSARINKICEFVSFKNVAEVGCDHAYILKTLLESGKISYAIASDISAKCLEKAKTNLKNFKNVAFCVGNGVENLPQTPKVEQIVIAGMGGHEIIKILSQEPAKNYNNFILQPQKNVYELRNFLQENNFEILCDEVVQEGKMFYFVLKVKRSKTNKPINLFEAYFGQVKNTKDYKNYLLYELDKCKQISQKVKNIDNETKITLIEQYLETIFSN